MYEARCKSERDRTWIAFAASFWACVCEREKADGLLLGFSSRRKRGETVSPRLILDSFSGLMQRHQFLTFFLTMLVGLGGRQVCRCSNM